MPTHFKGIKRDTAALNAYITLVRASETVLSRAHADLEARGLTLGQFGVLEALLHLGPMSQRELGRKLLRSGGNVTLVIDNLERHGWVRRERQEKDRRQIWIHLTANGRRLIEQVFPLHVKTIVKEFSGLDLKEQESLRKLCRKLGRGSTAKKDLTEIGKEIKEKHDDTSSTK
jgi:MarR family transcriptional regulator, 2-MHQ and catechol-resistance regulon repressor